MSETVVPGKTYNFWFGTRTTASVPATLAGSPVISVYSGVGADTQFTTGVTLTVDFDGITGSNKVAVDTTDATAYPVGDDFALFITTGTVNSVSAIGPTGEKFNTRVANLGIVQSGIITDAGSDTDDFVLPTGRRAGVTVGMVLEVEGIGARFIATYNAGTGVGTVTTVFGSDISLAFFRVRACPIADTASPVPATLVATGSSAFTESYAADGATATLPQLLYLILALLSEKSISGTTLTAKKLDGSTSAATFTLNDGTSPTSITRAS